MTSQSVSVVNQLGMHARAAAKFVHLAARYQSRVKVARHGREMDGKSILGLLLLAAAQGTIITISADGADERSAVEALGGIDVALIAHGELGDQLESERSFAAAEATIVANFSRGRAAPVCDAMIALSSRAPVTCYPSLNTRPDMAKSSY
jgi:phosphocarrier protein